MESLRWQLYEKYGARARIISAERIQTGGLFGMGATTTFEATVEIIDSPAPDAEKNRGPRPGQRLRARPVLHPGPNASDARAATPRRGIGDLLAEADKNDGIRTSPSTAEVVRTPDFDTILGELAGPAEIAHLDVADLGNMARAMPRPSQRPGDLIVLAGLREQPLHTAWSMISSLMSGADLLTAGDHRSVGVSHVFLDSVGVKRAQAKAASSGRPLLIAFSFGQRGSSNLSVLSSLRPDQLWLVVDAAHKPEDTQSWVRRACRYAVPDALAVVGVTDTVTPETINELRLPVGWVDGHQAISTEL